MKVAAKKVLAQQQILYYHVTYLNNLESIQTSGLVSGDGQTFTTYQYHSTGRVFITEESGISFWHSRYEDWANNKSDNSVEEGYIPVVLRFNLPDVENLTVDEVGTKDAFADSFYVEDGYIPPEDLEVYDGSTWVSLQSANIEGMRGTAYDAAELEVEEGEEDFLWPDYDVFLPQKKILDKLPLNRYKDWQEVHDEWYMGRFLMSDMKVWHLYGVVTGTKYLGQVLAQTEEEAVEKGYDLDTASVNLCHHCSGECSDPEIQQIIAEVKANP